MSKPTQSNMNPFLFDDRKPILFIDFFAGGGGASEGIKQAIGRDPDIAINHDEVALSMHAANHLHTVHLDVDVFEHHPKNVARGKKIAAWFSPDCFPEDSLVLTQNGYKPISEISVGEYVLTHNQRWRKVNKIFKSSKIVNTVKGQGHHGIKVSSEHPFYIREYRKFWNNDVRQYRHEFSSPQWIKAIELEAKKHFWGTPTVVPTLPIPVIGGRGMVLDENLLWLAGRYVGDGWSRLYKKEAQNRAEMVIICSKKEKDELYEKLNRWERGGVRSQFNEISWTLREMRSTYQFSTSHKGLVEWLRENFGHKAEHKTIPAWLYGAKKEYVEAFLDGYFSADGHKRKVANKDKHFVTTTSKKLAYGLKTILATLGRFANVYSTVRKPTTIEGRAVKTKPVFNIVWRNSLEENHQYAKKIDGIFWSRIKLITKSTETETVYNISVEEDESYVVEGIIVHNCTFHSNAKGKVLDRHSEHEKALKASKKGTKCVAQESNKATRVRGLAWVALGYAMATDMELFFLENVKEFKDWGPVMLTDDGEYVADPERKGETYQAFVQCLTTGLDKNSPTLPEIREFLETFLGDDYKEEMLFKGLGYTLESKLLKACDYGTPTTRERFYLIARKDGMPIVWPKPTHTKETYKTVAECIDWSIPCPSIFDTSEEIKAKHGINAKRPLAEKTLKRIAKGIDRFVINAKEPFIMSHVHHNEPSASSDPLSTIMTVNKHSLVVPYLQTYYGENKSQEPRGQMLNEPVRTITAKGLRHGIVVPFLTECANGSSQRIFNANEPMRTQVASTKGGHFALVSAFMAQHNLGNIGRDLNAPLSTVTTTGSQQQLVSAHIQRYFGQSIGHEVDQPSHTLTTKERDALIISHLTKMRGTNIGQSCDEPLQTITAGGIHFGEVRALLEKFSELKEEGHYGIVTIDGIDYQIVDIGMRMLTPRELFRAQGFPEEYIIDHDASGNGITKTAQVRMCGNSVCPPVAKALVEANFFLTCSTLKAA